MLQRPVPGRKIEVQSFSKKCCEKRARAGGEKLCPVLIYIIVFRLFSFFCLLFAYFFFSLPANVIQISSRLVNMSRTSSEVNHGYIN